MAVLLREPRVPSVTKLQRRKKTVTTGVSRSTTAVARGPCTSAMVTRPPTTSTTVTLFALWQHSHSYHKVRTLLPLGCVLKDTSLQKLSKITKLKMAKINRKKEYADYGEYLEDAYEEAMDRACTKYTYGPPSNRLTIKKSRGRLEAEWNRTK